MPEELLEAWRMTHYSRILRLCRWNHCEFEEPEALALKSDFSTLCLVSKQMRSDARNIFFARNKWVLHSTSSFDAIKWVLKYWGKEALCCMTDVRIELQSMTGIEMAYKSLENFTNAVRNSHSLRNLSVQWISSPRAIVPPGPSHPAYSNHSPHVPQIIREPGIERNCDGGRGRNTEPALSWKTPGLGLGAERLEWAERELLLQPLLDLRGIKWARIEGTVTESWAQHLEITMTASAGAKAHKFKFQPKAEDAARKLNERCSSGQY